MGNKASKSESSRVSTRRQSPELVCAEDVRRRDELPDNELVQPPAPAATGPQNVHHHHIHPGAKVGLVLSNFAAIGHNTVSVMKNEKVEVMTQAQKWTEVYVPRLQKKGWIPSNNVAPLNTMSRHPWFHRKITRQKAEWLLRNGINGSFLVRESESVAGQYSLSVRHEGKKYHYMIKNHGGRFWINEDSQFGTLPELIEHHSSCSSGLVTTLTHHVPNEMKPVLDTPADKWEIDRNSIVLGPKLGSGQYGEVYKGEWEQSPGVFVTIAVKTLKGDSASQSEFMKETTLMKQMKHENLLNLLGVCTLQKPFFMITQFMPHGSLLDYLRKYKDQIDSEFFLLAASQIAAGMSYLEAESMVHRDLACRNCLVDENLMIRICDFGLSRLLGEEDSYTAREGTKFPIKWTAPEALHYNTFSTKSDIWSFGIVLWELATQGETPYPATDLQEVLTLLECGYRMPKPAGCPDQVYELMLECWKWEPDLRPCFLDIVAKIENMFTSTSLEEEVERALHYETNGSGPRTTFSPGNSSHRGSTADLNSGKGTPDPMRRLNRGTPDLQHHPVAPARVKVPSTGSPRHQQQQQQQPFYPPQFKQQARPTAQQQQAPWYPPQPIVTNYPQAHIPNHPSNRSANHPSNHPSNHPAANHRPRFQNTSHPKNYPSMPVIPNYPAQKLVGPPPHFSPSHHSIRAPVNLPGPVKSLPQPLTPTKPRSTSECSSRQSSDHSGSSPSTAGNVGGGGGDLLSELKSRQSKRNRNTEPQLNNNNNFCAVNPVKHSGVGIGGGLPACSTEQSSSSSPMFGRSSTTPNPTTVDSPQYHGNHGNTSGNHGNQSPAPPASGNGTLSPDEPVNFRDILRGFQKQEQAATLERRSKQQHKIT